MWRQGAPVAAHRGGAVYDYALELWYPALKAHTFETEWIDLSWVEVRRGEVAVVALRFARVSRPTCVRLCR